MTAAAGVYDDAAADWAAGPAVVYAVLAEALLARLPADLAGLRCLDVGAGTGVASEQLRGRRADVVAVDLSFPMLRWQSERRPAALVGDVTRLPLAAASADVVVAAFCLNHLDEPGPA